jgi:hypothetical protein
MCIANYCHDVQEYASREHTDLGQHNEGLTQVTPNQITSTAAAHKLVEQAKHAKHAKQQQQQQQQQQH